MNRYNVAAIIMKIWTITRMTSRQFTIESRQTTIGHSVRVTCGEQDVRFVAGVTKGEGTKGRMDPGDVENETIDECVL